MSRPPLHLFLLSAYPILFLYARNQDHLPLGQLWLPLVAVPAAAVLLAVLVGRLMRNREIAAAWMSLAVLWVFSFGPLFRTLDDLSHGLFAINLPQSLALGLWGIALLVLMLVLIRFERHMPVIRRILDVAGLVLVLLTLVPIAVARMDLLRSSSRRIAPIASSGLSLSTKPNIYYVVLDAYGREDMLRDTYGFDNAPMIKFLRSRGFFVGDASHSNYCQTTVSLASSLNMEYVQNLVESEVEDKSSRQYALRLMRDGDVFRRLKALAYTVITFQSQYAVANIDNQDIHIKYSTIRNEFFEGLLAQTPADPFLALSGQGLSGIEYHRRAILDAIERIPSIPKSHRPFMVYAHIICPHPPFVFDRTGNNPIPGQKFSVADGNKLGLPKPRYRQFYSGQLEYINGRVRTMVDRILARDDASVIILQGDHGPGSGWHREHIDLTDLRERFSNLYAVRLPGGQPGPFYPSISPVNTFPVVFSTCFGVNIPLLEDRCYYSKMTRPYRFTLVEPEPTAPPPPKEGRTAVPF